MDGVIDGVMDFIQLPSFYRGLQRVPRSPSWGGHRSTKLRSRDELSCLDVILESSEETDTGMIILLRRDCGLVKCSWKFEVLRKVRPA